MLSDFAVSALGAGVVDAGGGVGTGAVADGVVIAGFGGSTAFSGPFPHAVSRAVAMSTTR
jgi:hypothetical protein